MTSYLLSGPPGEPVSLAEAKAYLRVEDDAEDGLVETLIGAARLHVEGVTGRALMAQTWRLVADAWPADRVIALAVGPLIALQKIVCYGADGETHEIALAQIRRETAVSPARLFLPRMIAGAPGLRERGGIEIDYVAGHGEDPGDVPADLRQAILALVAYWFEHRDAVIVAGSGAVIPSGFDRVLAPYRRVRL
ncbi:head-tail connector protein [Arsenicitalea aurantiaca]|nr:head-tail connector protein [Arsenicitalea aurantiaca]